MLFYTIVQLLLLITRLSRASKSNKVYQFDLNPFGDPSFRVTIGNPPVEVDVRFSSKFIDLFVLDSRCGKKIKTDCPIYCNDETLFSMFCHPLCRKISETNLQLYCLSDMTKISNYTTTNSSTFKPLNNGHLWQINRQKMRPLIGIDGTDKVVFSNYRNESKLELNVFPIKAILRGDHGIFNGVDFDYFNAMLGIAPGDLKIEERQNFFYKLYARGVIAEPIIALNGDSLTVGADDSNCKYAAHFDALEGYDYSWTFESEEFVFMNETFKRKTKIVWDSTGIMNQFPSFLMNLMWKRKLLVLNANGFFANENFDLEFKLGRMRLDFNVYAFGIPMGDKFYLPHLDPNGKESEYNEDTDWVFGYWATGTFCQSYDYGKRRLRVGYKW